MTTLQPGNRPRLAVWLALAAVVVALDQATKALVLQFFAYGDSVRITDFFNLVRVHNSGAAFSFLAGAGGWQRWFFVVLGLAASAFIVWMLRAPDTGRMASWALALILGGALGNVIDRLQHGHVVDFLDFHWAGRHFPSFNLADSAITLGAILLILDELRRMRRR